MNSTNEEHRISREEMNLVEFTIRLLAKRHDSGDRMVEFSDTILGENDKPIKREWVVTGSEKYGLPQAADHDVLRALAYLARSQDYDQAAIHFSRHTLCRLMGWTDRGTNYRRLEEALRRLAGVRVHAKNAFWDKEQKGSFTISFGIIDSFSLFDAHRTGEQAAPPLCRVELSRYFFESIKSGHIKSLDMGIYFELASDLAKRLYRYLDGRRHGRGGCEVNLYALSYVHLGLDEETFRSAQKIKEKLDAVHKELMDAGFLTFADYQPSPDGTTEHVIYLFDKKAPAADISWPGAGIPAEISPEESGLLARLTDAGVPDKVAAQLVREYPIEVVIAQLEALPHRNARDLPAVLVSSITNGWSLPSCPGAAPCPAGGADPEKDDEEVRSKCALRARIEKYLAALSEEQVFNLTCQARDLARQEGGALYQHQDIPAYTVGAYLHMLVEKRLELL